MLNYWSATDEIESSGRTPMCCGESMVAIDDHGRFKCWKCGSGTDGVTGSSLPKPRQIPQVNVSGMTDAQKARIPPIHRLNAPPTAPEADMFRLILQGKAGTPEYQAACTAVDEERKKPK